MNNKYISLMTRQMHDLVYITKLEIVLDEKIIPSWDKLLTTEERKSLKMAKTYLSKAISSIQDRTDNDSLRKYVYMLSNTSVLTMPTKEINKAVKELGEDATLVDVATSYCNPCKWKTPENCDVRTALDKAGYPAMWDDKYNNIRDLDEEEQRCMNHCKHCINLKLEEK